MNTFKNILLLFVGLIFLMGCPQPELSSSLPDPLSDYTSANIGTLKAVAGGTFNNGTADMTVSSFRMSQYEITRAQFLAIMGTDISNTTRSSGLTDPVQMVNWYHAIAFCNKLSLVEGLAPVYNVSDILDWEALNFGGIPTSFNASWYAATADWTANGYRLPTEAEWEFAALGGNATHGYNYAGSNTIGDVAVFGYYGEEIGKTTTERTNPVGSKAANELGLNDMTGNVYEWCWDWYDPYPGTAQTDYRGGGFYTTRVMRGGSWASAQVSISSRNHFGPQFSSVDVGFRVVRN